MKETKWNLIAVNQFLIKRYDCRVYIFMSIKRLRLILLVNVVVVTPVVIEISDKAMWVDMELVIELAIAELVLVEPKF